MTSEMRSWEGGGVSFALEGTDRPPPLSPRVCGKNSEEVPEREESKVAGTGSLFSVLLSALVHPHQKVSPRVSPPCKPPSLARAQVFWS